MHIFSRVKLNVYEFSSTTFVICLTYIDLDARKPVFEVCKQHRRRPACTSAQSDQCLCYSLLESVICYLVTGEISIFCLVSVAKETGLKLAFSETPKTGFLAMRPIL